jgi:hypothetical protein
LLLGGMEAPHRNLGRIFRAECFLRLLADRGNFKQAWQSADLSGSRHNPALRCICLATKSPAILLNRKEQAAEANTGTNM